MAGITGINVQPPVVEVKREALKPEIVQSKEVTKAKVTEVAKQLFEEVVFWGGVALAVTTTVVVLGAALSHPILSIAAIVLGCMAYKNRQKIAYIATLYLSVLKNSLGLSKWHSEINENITLGSVPLENKNHHKILKDSGVTDVLCLAQDFELETTTFVSKPVTKKIWSDEGINFKHIPIQESTPIGVKTIEKAVAIIDEVARKKGKIYVHCRESSGASASIIICYLMKHQNLSAKQAIALIKLKRPSIEINVHQRGRIHEYEDILEVQKPAGS